MPSTGDKNLFRRKSKVQSKIPTPVPTCIFGSELIFGDTTCQMHWPEGTPLLVQFYKILYDSKKLL